MKLSVSIPDWLWITCKIVRPDQKDSHIIQEALTEWIKQNENHEVYTELGKLMIERMKNA